MTGARVLELFAEISVALVGFTGVVAAFGMRGDALSELDVLRFRAMLYASIAVLLLSLVPLVLSHVIVREATLWRASSVAMMAYLVPFLAWSWRRLRGGGVSADPGFSRWISHSISVVMSAAVVVQALNAAGLGIGPGSGAYVLGLMALLVLCVIMFVRMLSFVGRREV